MIKMYFDSVPIKKTCPTVIHTSVFYPHIRT